MAKANSIERRMADFYFELEGPDGETQVFSSAEADADEDEMEDEED